MIKTVYNVNLFPLFEWLRQNLEFEELEFPSEYIDSTKIISNTITQSKLVKLCDMRVTIELRSDEYNSSDVFTFLCYIHNKFFSRNIVIATYNKGTWMYSEIK